MNYRIEKKIEWFHVDMPDFRLLPMTKCLFIHGGKIRSGIYAGRVKEKIAGKTRYPRTFQAHDGVGICLNVKWYMIIHDHHFPDYKSDEDEI